MGLADWFSRFCSNIQVKNGDSISRRCKAITKRLNTDFRDSSSDTANSFYVGSYGRNTAIHDMSDVDMIYVLPYSVYKQYDVYIGNGQSALLQAVRNTLRKTYSTSDIGADGQVIAIQFDDGITFEVLPGFVNDDGSYTFPDSNGGGSWKTTNPKAEISALRTRNDACNGNLIWLCRMARDWKRQCSVPMRGLLIDTLAYQFIDCWEYRDKSFIYYDWMCRDFFAFLADQDRARDYWKAPGSGQWVYGGKDQFQFKAKRAYNMACEAIAHECATPKQEWSAKQKWREIFGTSFPS